MPWSGTCMEQRARFVLEAQQGLFSMVDLCERYGVSRKTGYKWLTRYSCGGLAALEDESRAAHARPNATAPALVERILEERAKRPHWGPRKLRYRLQRLYPAIEWPAPSTIGLILNRSGLVTRRPRRARSRVVWNQARTLADAPNRVWSADFKGQFRLGDGSSCYPLTIMDSHSRFLLSCRALSSTRGEGARSVFEAAFRTFGVPEVIRTDNGPPFSAPTALQGLSRLAVWWIKLGIRLERSRPAHPQDNGAHERMHRTLKEEGTRPPERTTEDQQQRFDCFRAVYNDERPHAALDGATPAERYEASARRFAAPSEFDYPAHCELRHVTTSGQISWRGKLVFLSEALAHEIVALQPAKGEVQAVYFGPILLGMLPENGSALVSGSKQ